MPIRAGSDIAFLGGIIRYILENDRYFHEYVVNYTNAPAIINDDFRDTEDLDGLFSGWDAGQGQIRSAIWMYKDVEPSRLAERARVKAARTEPISGSRFRPSTPIRRCRIRAACFRF